MDKKADIILANFNYYPYHFGGTEIYVHNLASFLKQKGHRVTIFAAVPEEAFTQNDIYYEDDCLCAVNYNYEKINVVGVKLKKLTTQDIYLKYQNAWVESWRGLIQKLNFNSNTILHYHAHSAVISTAIAEALKQTAPLVRIVSTYHTPLSCPKGSLLFGNTNKSCYVVPKAHTCTSCIVAEKLQISIQVANLISMPLSYTDSAHKYWIGFKLKSLVSQSIKSFQALVKITNQWHVFSEQMLNVLQQLGVARSTILCHRHGIESSFTANESIKKKIDKSIFLYVGRFEKIKGFCTLLKAWLILPESTVRELRIIGRSTNDTNEITRLINKAKKRKDIIWLESLSRSDIKKEYEKAHAVIIPSECAEIGPLVFHEAMAFACNVIASNIDGIKELSDYYGETGIELFTMANVQSLMKRINDFVYIEKNELKMPSTYEQVFERIYTSFYL